MRQKVMLFSGFLGSGKTTTMIHTALYLKKKGIRVGLITNDLGEDLVDTNMARLAGVPVLEIQDGCLCHDVDGFVKTVDALTEAEHPDIIFAEPVGSCVDLVCSVYMEMHDRFAERYELLPFVGMVDPRRYESIYMKPETNTFNDEATYMYKKQLEDLDVIALNKCDLVSPEKQEAILADLRKNFPNAVVTHIIAEKDDNFEEWISTFTQGQHCALRTLDIDWDYICSGDNHMGWYNNILTFAAEESIDYTPVCTDLIQSIQKGFADRGQEIAHLKILCRNHTGYTKGAVTSTHQEVHYTEKLPGLSRNGEMNINIRAIAAPEIIREIIDAALKEIMDKYSLTLKCGHYQVFNSFGEAEPPVSLVECSC